MSARIQEQGLEQSPCADSHGGQDSGHSVQHAPMEERQAPKTPPVSMALTGTPRTNFAATLQAHFDATREPCCVLTEHPDLQVLCTSQTLN